MQILCYIQGNWAYFTTQRLDEVSGEGWKRVPYEHNSNTPYDESGHTITKVAFDGDFDQPCTNCDNSSYSVNRINGGAIPWLVTSRYSNENLVTIPGGITLEDFTKAIENGGGSVYFRRV